MKYALKLTYKDGKILEVHLKEEEAQDFFSCLSEGKIHWEKETGKGFWTNFSDIRFFEAFPQESQKSQESQKVKDDAQRNFGVPSEA